MILTNHLNFSFVMTTAYIKKILVILSFLLLTAGAAVANDYPDCAPDPDKKEKKERKSREEKFQEMQDFKMKYLLKKMEITDTETKEKFREAYSKMTAEKGKLFKDAFDKEKKIKNGKKELADEDYAKISNLRDECREKDEKINKAYDNLFKGFLTSKQIYKMHEAERDFNDRLRRVRGNHQMHKHKNSK